MAEERAGRPRPREATAAERREQRSRSEDAGEVVEAAARYLEARPRSEDEVRRKLLWLGYRAELVDEAVARLLAVGYLDDGAFARAWVESRDRARPRGEHALRRELGLRGVDRALVGEVLGERRDAAAQPGHDGPGADEAAAERLMARKAASILREPDPRRRLQRAYALLARNGFPPDVCSTVARRTLEATGEAGGEPDGVDP